VIPLPAPLAEQFQSLCARGEKLKRTIRTSSSWILLTDRALYHGDPLERVSREDVTGIEFDRAGAGPGSMFFMSDSTPLARIDFAGRDRAPLLDLEKAMAPRKRLVRLFLGQGDYAPGERVSGHVEIDWPTPSPVRGVRVGLVGTEATEITVTSGFGDHKSSTAYDEQDTLVAEEWVLFGGDRVDWVEAARETLSSLFGAQKHPVLPAGRHRFPFEIALPGDALPSYEGSHATVRYRLYAVVDVPLGFDRVFEGALTVVESREARIAARSTEADRRAQGFWKKLSADLTMGIQIKSSPYHYGEKLKVRLRVENESAKKIRSARLVLSAVESARAGQHNRDTTTELSNLVLKFTDPGAQNHDYEFTLPVPAWPIPFAGRYSRVDFWVSATLDVARGFDETLAVPIELTE
jgi:hypothetical protein